MQNHEIAMLAFARLARISHDKHQAAGRDRFLLLTGERACMAGWPEIAKRCRELVLLSNPRHLLSKSATFADCLRSEEGTEFFPTLQKFCTFERAEHLLRDLQHWPGEPDDDPGPTALRDLDTIDLVPT
jgi:hypothetical protein